MVAALKQMEAGRQAGRRGRQVGVSKHALYAWKAKHRGLEVSEAQEVMQLRDENLRLKKLLAGERPRFGHRRLHAMLATDTQTLASAAHLRSCEQATV